MLMMMVATGASAVTMPRCVGRRCLAGVVAGSVVAPASAMEYRASTAYTPSYTMLVPLVELEQTFEAWLEEVPSGNVSLVTEGLEGLAKGGIFSARNYYLGIGGKYATSIRYDDFDKQLVRRDRDERTQALFALDAAMDAATKRKSNQVALAAGLTDAVASIDRFLEMCPKADVSEARRSLAAFQAADTNHDGVVSEAEFYATNTNLTDVDRVAATWGVWAGAIVEHLRPRYAGLVDLDLAVPAPPVPDALRPAIAKMQF